MKKYYLIRLCHFDVSYNKKSLTDILRDNYPLLLKMEKERINMLYSTQSLNNVSSSEKVRYTNHQIKTEEKYEELGLPLYLICVGNNKHVKEIVTGNIISSKYPSALKICEVKKETAQEYYNDSEYYNKSINYFKRSKSIKNEYREETFLALIKKI